MINCKTKKEKSSSVKSTRGTMIDVLIALLPATVVGLYQFREKAAFIILASVLASVAAEALWQKLCGKKVTIGDFSAIITGLILSLILPIHVPIWIPIVGSIFATIIVKQFFGGVGHNFMNPAVAAKVFLMTSWASVMIKPVVEVAGVTTEAVSAASEATTEVTTEAVSSASEGATEIVQASTTSLSDIWQMFLNQSADNIGEVSVAALVVGGIYLLIRRRISFKIPLSFVITNVFLMWVLGGNNGLFSGDPIKASLSGVLFMAAIFMVNDPASSPRETKSQLVFGAFCGLLAAIFKIYGYNGEGPYYAILVVNLFVPVIERAFSKKIASSKEVAI